MIVPCEVDDGIVKGAPPRALYEVHGGTRGGILLSNVDLLAQISEPNLFRGQF